MDIPVRVLSLLRRCIHSVEQLEVLLHLRAHADRGWTSEEVADATFGSRESIDLTLMRLADHELVRMQRGQPPTYQYVPSSDLRARVDELATLYAERRVAIITAIALGPMEHVIAFSDAFRLRRSDD